jgi:hypothetical protein
MSFPPRVFFINGVRACFGIVADTANIAKPRPQDGICYIIDSICLWSTKFFEENSPAADAEND